MPKSFILKLGFKKYDLTNRPLIMGILNITPDSFSNDGLCNANVSTILDKAKRMADDGADIIDVGGESSRPGSSPLAINEEILRTIPIIKKLSNKIHIPISIDTYKPEVAKQALDNGACIVNDITALGSDEKMAEIVKKYRASIVLMHMRGKPRTMQKNPKYKSVINDVLLYLKNSVNRCLNCGIKREKIIIDPGIGFGKTVNDNLKIINNLEKFRKIELPILIGISRKSFIGKILNAGVSERLIGTISAECAAIIKGANMLRVHDIKETKQMVGICQAILHSNN